MMGHDSTKMGREPLSAEERALAERLARIGPNDGPSPALDAKILRAAHAAAAKHAPSRRHRWLALMGVPPTLITGVGVAAAAVLALGLVWQLRPTPTMLPAVSEEESAGTDDIFVAAEQIAEPRPKIANPPPLPAEMPERAAATPQRAMSAPQADTGSGSGIVDKAVAPTEMAAAVAEDAAAETAPAAAPAAPSSNEYRATAAKPAAAAPAQPAFVPAPPPAPAAPSAQARRRASYTNSARATADRREAEAVRGAPAPVVESFSKQAADTEQDEATLDRVEIVGSRTAADAPVRDDVALEPADWLERIRQRRDAGDLDAARESLRLFREAHPRARIPTDLRDL